MKRYGHEKFYSILGPYINSGSRPRGGSRSSGPRSRSPPPATWPLTAAGDLAVNRRRRLVRNPTCATVRARARCVYVVLCARARACVLSVCPRACACMCVCVLGATVRQPALKAPS